MMILVFQVLLTILLNVLWGVYRGYLSALSFSIWLKVLCYVVNDNRKIYPYSKIFYGCNLFGPYTDEFTEYVKFRKEMSYKESEVSKILGYVFEGSPLGSNLEERIGKYDSKGLFKRRLGILREITERKLSGKRVESSLLNIYLGESTEKIFRAMYLSDPKGLLSAISFLWSGEKEFIYKDFKISVKLTKKSCYKVTSQMFGLNCQDFFVSMTPEGVYRVIRLLEKIRKYPLVKGDEQSGYGSYNLKEIFEKCNKKSFFVYKGGNCLKSKSRIHSSRSSNNKNVFSFFVLILINLTVNVLFFSLGSEQRELGLLLSILTPTIIYSKAKRTDFIIFFSLYRIINAFSSWAAEKYCEMLVKFRIYKFCPINKYSPVLCSNVCLLGDQSWGNEEDHALMELFLSIRRKKEHEVWEDYSDGEIKKTFCFKRSKIFLNLNLGADCEKRRYYKITKGGNPEKEEITLLDFEKGVRDGADSLKEEKEYFWPGWDLKYDVSVKIDDFHLGDTVENTRMGREDYLSVISLVEMLERGEIDSISKFDLSENVFKSLHSLPLMKIIERIKLGFQPNFVRMKNPCYSTLGVQIEPYEDVAIKGMGWTNKNINVISKIVEYTRIFWKENQLSYLDLSELYCSVSPLPQTFNRNIVKKLPNKKMKVFLSDLNYILGEANLKNVKMIYRTEKFKKSRTLLGMSKGEDYYFVKKSKGSSEFMERKMELKLYLEESEPIQKQDVKADFSRDVNLPLRRIFGVLEKNMDDYIGEFLLKIGSEYRKRNCLKGTFEYWVGKEHGLSMMKFSKLSKKCRSSLKESWDNSEGRRFEKKCFESIDSEALDRIYEEFRDEGFERIFRNSGLIFLKEGLYHNKILDKFIDVNSEPINQKKETEVAFGNSEYKREKREKIRNHMDFLCQRILEKELPGYTGRKIDGEKEIDIDYFDGLLTGEGFEIKPDCSSRGQEKEKYPDFTECNLKKSEGIKKYLKSKGLTLKNRNEDKEGTVEIETVEVNIEVAPTVISFLERMKGLTLKEYRKKFSGGKKGLRAGFFISRKRNYKINCPFTEFYKEICRKMKEDPFKTKSRRSTQAFFLNNINYKSLQKDLKNKVFKEIDDEKFKKLLLNYENNKNRNKSKEKNKEEEEKKEEGKDNPQSEKLSYNERYRIIVKWAIINNKWNEIGPIEIRDLNLE